jgi:hypothetical protein
MSRILGLMLERRWNLEMGRGGMIKSLWKLKCKMVLLSIMGGLIDPRLQKPEELRKIPAFWVQVWLHLNHQLAEKIKKDSI